MGKRAAGLVAKNICELLESNLERLGGIAIANEVRGTSPCCLPVVSARSAVGHCRVFCLKPALKALDILHIVLPAESRIPFRTDAVVFQDPLPGPAETTQSTGGLTVATTIGEALLASCEFKAVAFPISSFTQMRRQTGGEAAFHPRLSNIPSTAETSQSSRERGIGGCGNSQSPWLRSRHLSWAVTRPQRGNAESVYGR